MLKKLFPVLMGVAGAGAGIAVATVFPGGAPEVSEAEAHAETKSTKEHADPKDHGDHSDHGDHAGESDGYEYVKLTNQFVVPIVEQKRVVSMVVLSLSLEAVTGQEQKIYTMEPKLRDGFLRVLFDHANMGGFGGTFTDAAMLDVLRNGLRDVARRELGDKVRNVLIVDIARQDV